ncbi:MULTISPECIES: hypothetical protein [unclassified Lentimonas]|uniref:type IV pilus modification PilV family protein n=1 Tax=unclassified Lentimonas TaxID=2630993 RepID=UPI0013249613|nr:MULTISPECIES: hypothetical protein [unclassified Lentimonas]CAA6676849.1 Unannotated [Lentimonas sp. CC4]CAA6686656.1 Unannotated [Lentimonas sp. CC6]CAA7075767.1 Unannotated [Lentimonas sp. CC4]CAA7168074.1 Unannotated [Lentimonas sp. CC21]CAA7181778.1 Unannotated [Lentimonas sp. CC8]
MHSPDNTHLSAKTNSSRVAAFTLVEVMGSMFLFTLFALAFMKGLLFCKVTAEDNLYDATALTVAISTIEQMKGASISLLESPPTSGGKETFEMIIEDNTPHTVFLGETNLLQVPIVTNSTGSVSKTLDVTIIPDIQEMDNNEGFWLSIQYSYDHPRNGRTRTYTVHNARSTIKAF